MDSAHFDELMGKLALTEDTRLLELTKRNSHLFALLLTKMIETAVQSGIADAGLYQRVHAAKDNVSRLGHARMSPALRESLKGQSFNITWGPDHGRPTGYYVSIPNYNGGAVVPLEVVENLLRDNLVLPRDGQLMGPR